MWNGNVALTTSKQDLTLTQNQTIYNYLFFHVLNTINNTLSVYLVTSSISYNRSFIAGIGDDVITITLTYNNKPNVISLVASKNTTLTLKEIRATLIPPHT